MTFRSTFRWLSRQLINVAMRVSPGSREGWAQAMSREFEEIADDQEALEWALGCVQASCYERLKSMKRTSYWPVRWGMALWIALLAIDAFTYAEHALTYKLGLFTEPYFFSENIPLLKVTPIWEPLLTLAVGVMFFAAVILIVKRSRAALYTVVVPFVMMLLLFAIRASRPESGIVHSLSVHYQNSPSAMIWPLAGLAITIVICLALWRDRQTPPHREV